MKQVSDSELRSHATLIEPDLLNGLMAGDDSPRSLQCDDVAALQQEVLQLRKELTATQRDLRQAQQKIAENEQERIESEEAARQLHDALAQYLSHQDAQGAEQHVDERSAVDSSWASLEQRVMGMSSIKRMDARTPRGVASPGTFAKRRSSTLRPCTPRSLRTSISMAQDPIGNIGELVAKAARERKARQESSALPEEATPLVPVRMQSVSSPTKPTDMPLCTQRPLHMPPLETPAVCSPSKVTPPPRGGASSPMSSVDSFAVTREAPPTDRRASLHMHTNVLAMQSASNSLSATSPSRSVSGDCNASGDDAASSCSHACGLATDRSSSSSQGSRIPALHDPDVTEAASAPPAASAPAPALEPAPTCSPEGIKGHRVAAPQRKPLEAASTQLPFGRSRRAAASGVSRSSDAGAAKSKSKPAMRAGGTSRR